MRFSRIRDFLAWTSDECDVPSCRDEINSFVAFLRAQGATLWGYARAYRNGTHMRVHETKRVLR